MLLLAVVILLPSATHHTVEAQGANAYRCQDAQAFLENTVRKNDLATRVNRTQLYEFIYDNLETLTKRLQENEQAGAEPMSTALTQYQKKINTFKSDYERYDAARQAVIEMPNCSGDQQRFETLLKDARKKRTIVAKDIANLKAEISNELNDSLDSLYITLAQKEEQ